jgi:hypothetical protein
VRFFDSTNPTERTGEAIGSLLAIAICALVVYTTLTTMLSP